MALHVVSLMVGGAVVAIMLIQGTLGAVSMVTAIAVMWPMIRVGAHVAGVVAQDSSAPDTPLHQFPKRPSASGRF